MVGVVDSNEVDYHPLPPKGPVVVVWWPVLYLLSIHLMFVYTIYLTIFVIKMPTTIWALTFGYVVLLSVTVGTHRLFSHRSFKAHPLLRLSLLLLFAATGQQSTYTWARNHRLHHKYTETDADPHNSQRGFFYSHMGWLMCRKQPQMVEKERKIDMSDHEADPYIMFQKRHYLKLYILMGILIPMAVPYFLLGETLFNSFMSAVVFRTVLVYNMTWSINSVAHMFGTRPYTRTLEAVESPLVAVLAVGEGWHNYHHTFPWDYRASEFGQILNNSATLIDLFHKLGWVWDLRQATPEMVNHRVLRHGDGTHPLVTSNKNKHRAMG